MKIGVIPFGKVPSQKAHSINTIKHANSFAKLGHYIEIFTVNRLYEDILKLKLPDINKYYGINPDIRFNFFHDKSIFYFNDLIKNVFNSLKNSKISLTKFLDQKKNSGKTLRRINYQLPNFYQRIKTNFYLLNKKDPEKKISNSLKKKSFDLCYTRAYRTLFYNIQNKIPSVWETHDPKIWKPEIRLILNSAKNDSFKGIITISDVLKKIYDEAGVPKKKILVLEDSVDLIKYDSINEKKTHLRKLLNLPKNKKIIMYTGSLYEGRGIDTIIDSANKLGNKDLLFLIIGGNDKEIKRWKKYRKDKPNQFHLKFMGFIHKEKIHLYQKAADILLAPYTSECQTAEWMSPIKIFEYMASNVPIICSNLKRLKQICNHGECLFFQEGSPSDLKEKIEELLNNKELRENLVESAYNTVKKHTYQKRCSKILNYFFDF